MEKNYVIVVDSTTDLPPNIAEELGVTVVPLIFRIDDKEYLNYLDYRELSVKDFYDALRAGKTASTAQNTVHKYMEAWEPFLKEGKDILYMCLSSALSKSYDQSVLASREAMEEYPDRKVITIDSRSASLGQGLLAYYASQAQKEGKSLEENAAYIEALIPKLNHWVVPDDLHHLRRGGRVSGASAFVGTMLSIKPILTIVDDGRLIPASKARGWGKAEQYIFDRMKEQEVNADTIVFIAHSDSQEKADKVADTIREKFGVKKFIINCIGPVIGAHTGPGTLAIIFLGKNRPKE